MNCVRVTCDNHVGSEEGEGQSGFLSCEPPESVTWGRLSRPSSGWKEGR